MGLEANSPKLKWLFGVALLSATAVLGSASTTQARETTSTRASSTDKWCEDCPTEGASIGGALMAMGVGGAGGAVGGIAGSPGGAFAGFVGGAIAGGFGWAAAHQEATWKQREPSLDAPPDAAGRRLD